MSSGQQGSTVCEYFSEVSDELGRPNADVMQMRSLLSGHVNEDDEDGGDELEKDSDIWRRALRRGGTHHDACISVFSLRGS